MYAKRANSTRPSIVTATAIATPRLRVPNSAANVNRSRGSAVTIAAAIHPAATEHDDEHGSERNRGRQVTEKGSRIVQDDEHQHEPDADERQVLQCGLVPPGPIGPASPCPHSKGHGKGEHQQELGDQGWDRHRQFQGLCGHHLEEPANGRHRQPAQETREACECHRQCRGGARHVAVGVGNAADRTGSDEKQAGSHFRRGLKAPREGDCDWRQQEQGADQPRQHECRLTTHATEVVHRQIESDAGEQHKGEHRHADVDERFHLRSKRELDARLAGQPRPATDGRNG